MTRKKRIQFIALDALLGFADEALKLKGIEPRTWSHAAKLRTQVKRMLDNLGPSMTAGTTADILRRFGRIKKALKDEAPQEILVLDYANALLFVVEIVARHTSGKPVGRDWDAVFDTMQELYETMDSDLAETASMKRGSQLGERLWEAIAA